MDEDKALQNLSDYPVEFAKYPFGYMHIHKIQLDWSIYYHSHLSNYTVNALIAVAHSRKQW